MKAIKQRPDLLLIVLLPLIFFLGLCYYLYPSLLHYAFYLNWASTTACIVILLLPGSGKKIGENKNGRSFLDRYAITWLTQILLFLSFIIVCHLIDETHLNSSDFTINVYNLGLQFFSHYGFYPWTTYCIIAVSMAWLAYYKKSPATFSATTALPNTNNNDSLGIIINSGMRNVSFFAISLTLTAAIIVAGNLFYQNILHIHSGWNAAQIGCSLFFSLLYFLSTKKRIFHKKLFKRLDLFQVLFFFSITAALFFGLFYAIINLVGIKPFQTPALLTILLNHSWKNIWYLTATLWWLSWTPLMAIQLAKQCSGISIRSSVIMLLSLPLISNALFYGLYNQNQISSFNHLFTTNQRYLWVSIMAVIVFFFILTKKTNRHVIVNNELPTKDKIKYRPFTYAQESSIKNTLAYLILFLLGGCYLLNLFLVAMILPSILYPCLLITGKIKQAWQLKNNSKA